MNKCAINWKTIHCVIEDPNGLIDGKQMSWKREKKCAGNVVFHIMLCVNLKRSHCTGCFTSV